MCTNNVHLTPRQNAEFLQMEYLLFFVFCCEMNFFCHYEKKITATKTNISKW